MRSGLSGCTSCHLHSYIDMLQPQGNPTPGLPCLCAFACSPLCLDCPSHRSPPGLANFYSSLKAQHRCLLLSKAFREHQVLAFDKILTAYCVQDIDFYSMITHTYFTCRTVPQKTLGFVGGGLCFFLIADRGTPTGPVPSPLISLPLFFSTNTKDRGGFRCPGQESKCPPRWTE